MAEEAGIVYFEAGPNQQTRYELGSVTTEQLTTAAGATGTYIDGKGRPSPVSGASLDLHRRAFKTPSGEVLQVHRFPGEALYLSLDARAVDQLDTSTFTNTEIHEVIVNVRTGARRTPTWALADRITDVNAGGVADDPFTVVGQKVPMLAFPRLGPEEVGVLERHVRLTTGDQ